MYATDECSRDVRGRYDAFKDRNLKLDMTRGKPSPAQLDLAAELMTMVGAQNCRAADGTDCRNYGGLDGLPEAKALFADYMEVSPSEIIIGGNASLNLMYDAAARAMLNGVPGGDGPWHKAPVKFLCPVPGYDRHYNVCLDLGIEMINVPMNEDGPDMETVARLAAEDAAVKGIWCVPKYSNPTGIVYSAEVVQRLASMPTKAPDFRIFWDNAYQVHHLTDERPVLANILRACEGAGNPDRVYMFGSTSKISLAGGGISMLAASRTNIDHILGHMKMQTIGPDKVNQLRHVRFFRDRDGILAHMERHRQLLAPKFEAVHQVLGERLKDTGLATWTHPKGGYFISLDTRPGKASRVVALAGDVGVKLTPAGATFPYRRDPEDRNIRIAPSLPSLDEIHSAMDVVATCIELAEYE